MIVKSIEKKKKNNNNKTKLNETFKTLQMMVKTHYWSSFILNI